MSVVTTRQDEQLAVLNQILSALGGLVERVDALESGKAGRDGIISITGTVDGVPAEIVGEYFAVDNPVLG